MNLPHPQPEESGDRRTRWIGAHQTGLWRYLRWLGCAPERADDLLQETLLRGLEHGIDSRPAAVAREWLRTTARHLVAAELRRRVPRADLETLEREFAAVEERWDEELDALRTCVDGLGPRAREALALHYREGLSVRQLGARLGVSPVGAKSLLRRLRERLRLCVQKRLHGVRR